MRANRAAPKARTVEPSIIERARVVDRRRQDHRRFTEVLVHRAELLLPADGALVLAAYRDGQSASHIAALRGEPASVRSIRRRLRQLVKRTLSHRFEFTMRARSEWPPCRRSVAEACVLQGRSMRDAARTLDTSLHAVRREMAVINALIEEDGADRDTRTRWP